jgi:uncharacterized membrane protein HdeD (DUF308 family)
MTAVPDRHGGSHPAAGRPTNAAGATTVSSRHMLALGSITMVFGVAVLAWPAATLRLLGVLIGVWLIATGALRLIRTFRGGHGAEKLFDRMLSGGLGIVLVLAGAACVSNAATGVVALAVILGLAWLLSGVAEILFGLFSRGGARVWLITLGVASIGVGLLFVAWPDISSRTLVLLTGITALILGTGEVSFGWQQRHRPA